ncbi:MAG: type II toxin-antitoxin system VapC family toxin [Fervidicoccaceae archaeon]
MELVSRIFDILNLHSVKGFEKDVMDIAVKEGVTFCDASYMYVAIRNKLTLVTCDRKLMSVARKYVNVVTTGEITT